AFVVAAAVSGLLFLVVGIPPAEESEPTLRQLAVLGPLYLGLLVLLMALLRLVLLVPQAFFLWLVRLGLGVTGGVGRALAGERGAVEARPFTHAALLAAVAVLGVWVMVAVAAG
ncbi:MAG: hypothetical protein JO040_15665, partial [Gemmatimonadetes bacterium]|nr:hypothetical protein [Gemmatimonadota bacterium]